MIIRPSSVEELVLWFNNGDDREIEGSQLTIIASFSVLKYIRPL